MHTSSSIARIAPPFQSLAVCAALVCVACGDDAETGPTGGSDSGRADAGDTGENPTPPESPKELADLFEQAWSEPAARPRDAILARIWAEDGVYEDTGGPTRGRAALSERMGTGPVTIGARFERTTDAMSHNQFIHFGVKQVNPDGSEPWLGVNLGHIDAEGRLDLIVAFPEPIATLGADQERIAGLIDDFERAWSEPDAVARLSLLRGVLTEDGAFYASNAVHEGAQAISDFMGQLLMGNAMPAEYRRVGGPQVVETHARYAIEGEQDGTIFEAGDKFATLSGDGKIRSIVLFRFPERLAAANADGDAGTP